MGNSITYQDLDVWQQNRILVKMVYQHSQVFPKEEQFGLTQQVRKSAISIPSNIAEGCGKTSTKQFSQSLEVSLGESFELETQLIIAHRTGLITAERVKELEENLSELQRMINGLKASLAPLN